VCSLVNLWFAAKIELCAANQRSLPKVCVLQRISVRCRKCVFYIKLAFAAESVLAAVNEHSLLKFCACSELAFVVEGVLVVAK
jgi:hypothetical protein